MAAYLKLAQRVSNNVTACSGGPLPPVPPPAPPGAPVPTLERSALALLAIALAAVAFLMLRRNL